VEEHGIPGGFAEAVIASLASQGISVPVRALAVPDEVVEHGSQDEWRAAIGIDAAGIERAGRALLGG
jgi:1-deoxy-D-xylulose-5-phosphate synthase